MSCLSIVNKVASHDKESMLQPSLDGHSCHDYIGDERRSIIATKIEAANPFSTHRKKVEFYDKSKGSPFFGLSEENVERFVDRNKKLYCKNLRNVM